MSWYNNFLHVFDKTKRVKRSYLLYSRGFQLTISIMFVIFWQYAIQTENEKIRNQIAEENKKLRQLKEILN